MRFTLRRAGLGALLLFLPALGPGLAATGCGGSTSNEIRQARPFAPQEYLIGIEDLLEINVWKEPQLSTTAPVRPDGKVTVPVAGEIQAAGHTAKELEAILTQKLAERIASPTVTVVVKEVNGSRVFILGEVAKPGAYPIRGSLTVVQALALAGGLTEFANQGNITILRRGETGGQTRYKLDLHDAYGAPIELSPGDTVVVP